MTVKKRNSNYEFLRILAIILITLNHITTKGLSLNPAAGSGANNALALLYTCGGKFGCILFLPRTLLAGFAILLIGAFISLLYEYVLGRPVTDLLSKIGAAKDRAAKEA